MTILVCGGAGYIGSHFVKAAISAGHQVIVIDNLQTGHLSAISKFAIFCKGDLRDRDFITSIFSHYQIDACVHFAACSLVGESMEKPMKYFDNNVFGTIVLLDVMAQCHVNKIVFSSSAAVYGSQDQMPIEESASLKPENPYGESKLMMEKIMRWADLAHGVRYISLRYFNVAGASGDSTLGEDHRPETHLIPNILQVPLGARKSITIFGSDYPTADGTCVRDYIHVEDLARAHLLALNHLSHSNQSDVFNLGSRQGYSNLEIVDMARKVSQHAIPVVFGPRRAGDPAKLVASNDKALKLLGWQPALGLDAIIRSAWEFHRQHPHGYEE